MERRRFRQHYSRHHDRARHRRVCGKQHCHRRCEHHRGRASHDWARSRCAHTERDGAVESDERQEAGRGAEGQRGRGRIGQKASAQLYSNAHSTALFVSKLDLKIDNRYAIRRRAFAYEATAAEATRIMGSCTALLGCGDWHGASRAPVVSGPSHADAAHSVRKLPMVNLPPFDAIPLRGA